MSDWIVSTEKDAGPERAIDSVRRICKQRMEQLKHEMGELDEMAKRAAMQRSAVSEELTQLERVLEATVNRTESDTANYGNFTMAPKAEVRFG